MITYTGKHTKLPGIDCAASMRVAATRDVMQRLADYEDTGLTPEQVEQIKRDNARLELENAQTARELQAICEKMTTRRK